MPRSSNARQQMLQTAIQLMRERGVEATSFSEVLEHSGAPRGSIYHHFPNGKDQLIEEATYWAGEFIAKGEEVALADGPMHALDSLIAYWRAVLRDSDFVAGCPIAAVAVEGEIRPGARDVAAEVFERWEKLLASSFRDRGIDRVRANSLATTIVAAVEGAVILSRAKQSLTPVDRVGRELQMLLSDALGKH